MYRSELYMYRPSLYRIISTTGSEGESDNVQRQGENPVLLIIVIRGVW
jgi:hypothetical protein